MRLPAVEELYHVFAPDPLGGRTCILCRHEIPSSESGVSRCIEYIGLMPKPLFVSARALSTEDRIRVLELLDASQKTVFNGRFDVTGVKSFNAAVWLVYRDIMTKAGWKPTMVPGTGKNKISWIHLAEWP